MRYNLKKGPWHKKLRGDPVVVPGGCTEIIPELGFLFIIF